MWYQTKASEMPGADAVQIGRAFLATDESNATAIHKQMLFSDAAKYTTLSRAFTGRLGRGITTRIARDMSQKDNGFRFLILFWGGQIAPALRHTKAAGLMRSLIEETTAYFNTVRTML